MARILRFLLPLACLAATAAFTATASAAATTATFPATADAYVDSGNPTKNFGAATQLNTDNSPQQYSYFRFAVSGTSGTVTSAKLRLWVSNGSTNGPAIFSTDGLWSEQGVTWNNKPAASGASSADLGNVPASAFVDYDVTPLVTGNGEVNFVTTTTSSDAMNVSSREDADATHQPQLIVTTDGGSTPVDTTAPDTRIDSGPPASTTDTSATFAFSSPDADATAYECQLDAGAYAACASPKAYTGLAAGSHTFSVRASDAAGNTDATPATQTWTVTTTPPADTTAPDTTLSSGPPASTTDTSATFAFTSPDADTTAYECQLDAAAFASCNSPKTYTGLAVGSHTFSVRASDAAGNTDATPATQTWTITDSGSGGGTPGTSTFAATADAYVDSLNPAKNFGTTATLNTDNDPPQSSYLRFAVSGTSGTVTSAKLRVWVTNGSSNGPAVYATSGGWTETGLTWGNKPAPTGAAADDKASVAASAYLDYDVTALVTGNGEVNLVTTTTSGDATDVSSREDATAAHRPQLIVTTSGGSGGGDTTAPDTRITSGPAASTTATTATFAFDSPDADATGFECQLDAAAYAACTSPKDYTGLTAGSHTFSVRASDAAGNTDATPATQTWTVTSAQTAPATPTGLTATGGTGQIALTWTASTGAATYNLYRSTTSTIGATPYKTGLTTTSFTDTGLAAGATYYYAVSAVNAAGESQKSTAVNATTTSGTAGLVALWHMEEASGSTMLDAVGNHTGTLHSVTYHQPGYQAFGFGFNGSSSYAEVPNASDLIPGTKNVTLTLHMKTGVLPPTTVEDWDLMRKGLYTSGSEFKMEYYPTGQAGCGFRGSVSYTGEHPVGPKLNDNQWHTIQCVKTGSQAKTIVDGVTVYTQTIMVGSITTTDRVVIGARPGSEYFKGTIDEVSIAYN